MRYELECNVPRCRKRVWVTGIHEETYFIREESIPEDACEHIFDGNYSIIDEEEESDE